MKMPLLEKLQGRNVVSLILVSGVRVESGKGQSYDKIKS